MTSTAIAVIGPDRDASDVLYQGLNKFPAEKIYLLCEQKNFDKTKGVEQELKKFHTATEILLTTPTSFQQMFKVVGQIKEGNPKSQVIVHVDTDYASSCVALSASFVNGVQAIGILEGKLIAYPIMRFSYYTALSDKKKELLKKIYEKKQFNSLEELSKDTNMSLPLTTYHVRGNKKAEGLEQLGLVETTRIQGRISFKLSQLGILIAEGLVKEPPEEELKKRK